MKKIAAYILVFILGAVLGTLYDFIHVISGVLHYSHPDLYGESFLVPLEFGAAGFVFMLLMDIFAWKYGKFDETNFINCVHNALLLLTGYIITALFSGRNIVTFIFLIPLATLAFMIHGVKRERNIIFITSFVGPVCEAVISSTGFFKYNHADPVPYWLPILYVIAGGLFIEVSKYFIQWSGKKQL